MTHMTRALLLLPLLAACGHLTPAEAGERLDVALREAVEDDPGVHAGLLLVDAPALGLQRSFAHGVADVGAGTKVTTQTPFLSASVGKLVIAEAVRRLAARGVLSLDDPLTRFVPLQRIAGLPVVGGDEALAKITLRQLLAHRSGLPDYFSGPSKDRAPRLFTLVEQEPERRFTRDELLDWARLHYAPAGAPGERFAYADTNYDLLGLVLEGAAGRPFHEVVRAEVFEPLGLRATWYHAFEPAPAGLARPADVWLSEVNLAGRAALSADQAGGGLYTTLEDLRLLVRGLATGTPSAFDELSSEFTEDAMHDGIDVGLAVWRVRPGGVFFALAGLPTMIGHSGATGVWAYWVPEWDAVLVGAMSQSAWQEKHLEFVLAELYPVLARLPRVPPPPR